MNEKYTKKEKMELVCLFSIPIVLICIILFLIIWSKLQICDHTWENTSDKNSCVNILTCSKCKETEKTISHNWTGATCKKPGVCSRCGETGSTLSHEYAFGKCKLCGESESFYKFTEDDDEDDFWFAITSAQNLVKNELKSPSPAKFPWDGDEYVVKKNGSDWKVSGYVDAQNSFGASLRTNWTAIFTMGDTSGSTYKVSNYIVTFP